MSAPYIPALYGGEASDWLRPRPWQRQSGYPIPGHLTCNPLSWRGASHVGSQGEEAIPVTHNTLPQVVKASVLYYEKIKTYVQVITGN